MDENARIWREHAINGKTFALVVQTRHGDTIATTAVHEQNFSRRIGGVRCILPPKNGRTVEGLAEVGHLSSTMTDKCMAAMIPADGQKSLVVTTPEILEDDRKRVAILTAHERAVISLDPGVIFGPDMKVSETIQDALSRQDGLLDHLTGFSSDNRGLSIDLNGYTGFGVAQAIQTVYPGAKLEDRTVSVQGFGAVGAHTALLMARAGARVVAVSNELGALVADGGAALDVEAMFQAWAAAGNDEWIRSYSAPGVRMVQDPHVLFETEAEIFIPAARTSILATAAELDKVRLNENPSVRGVEYFFAKTGVRLIAEGANHPLSEAAEEYLEQRGVVILPDYIINCGGLIGCWVEWEARHGGFADAYDELAKSAREQVRKTVRSNVEELRLSSSPARAAGVEIVMRNRERLITSR